MQSKPYFHCLSHLSFIGWLSLHPEIPQRGCLQRWDCAMGRRDGQTGEKGIMCYLEDRMYRWKAPHGGYSNNFSHQMSPQKMRVQLMKLEVRATDPAFG